MTLIDLEDALEPQPELVGDETTEITISVSPEDSPKLPDTLPVIPIR
jgi:hypothetical protein